LNGLYDLLFECLELCVEALKIGLNLMFNGRYQILNLKAERREVTLHASNALSNTIITLHLYVHVRLQIQDILEHCRHESFVDTSLFNVTALNERGLDDVVDRLENIRDRSFAVIKLDDSSGSDQDFNLIIVNTG